MSASLVGSEMCIRDRLRHHSAAGCLKQLEALSARFEAACCATSPRVGACLLYTSDAADDM
eukprot:2314303-Alexandrium_andersonii.AAC.1